MTFRNSSTKKSTTKKFRCVVKPANEEPVEPTPAEATKISSVTATAADTIEVKFDAPVADATKEIKLDRAGVSVEATATWSDAKDSVVLVGKTAFAAGTYTVTYGEMTGSCVVSARKATSIEVLTTKIGLGTNLGTDQKVFFNVLDQYGKAMNYSANRMTITATNLSKGLNMNPSKNTTTTNPYFELTTSAASMAIGDNVAVVIALTSDPTVITTANLTIDNIYTESFEFGEVDLAGDAHAYVNQGSKYSINYTATDTEGKAVLLSRNNSLGATATVNNITFVSSNTNTINPQQIRIDANGKLYFTTGAYASKVTLTAVNNVTGKTDTIEIQVGESSKATRLDITDITVAKSNYTTGNTIGKADVIVYDQYGDIMKNADIAKLSLSGLFNVTSGLGTVTAEISDDGKYLVYKAGGAGFDASTSTIGTVYNVNFVSTTDATVTSVGKITIGDVSELASIKEVAAPKAVVIAGGDIEIKASVLDNYDAAQQIAVATTNTAIGATIGSIGRICVEDPGQVVSSSSISVTSNDVSTIKLTTKTIAEAYKSATVRLVLKNMAGEEVDSKTYSVIISNDADTYDVSTDKTVYTSGDKIAVTVKAMKGITFLGRYSATVPVTIAASGSSISYNRDLTFENGTATVDIPATTGTTDITVTKAGAGATGTKSGLTVNTAGTPTKLAIAATGSAVTISAIDNTGTTVTSYEGYKTATIKVTNAAGMDVTGDFITAANISSVVDSDGNVTLNFASGEDSSTITDLANVSASGNIVAGTYVITISIGTITGTIVVSVS